MKLEAVFFDWHGVLCDQRFWHHLPPEHPLVVEHAPALFADQAELEAWMRGERSSTEILERGLPPDQRQPALRELEESCRLMEPKPELVEWAWELKPRLRLLAVASDNMDCFARAWPRLNLEPPFAGLLCSSSLGALKQTPRAFFGRALAARGIERRQALLIDDRPDVCAAFEDWGGHAIRFSSPDQARAELEEMLDERENPLQDSAALYSQG